MLKERKHTFAVRLTATQVELLREISKKDNCSVGATIRRIIDEATIKGREIDPGEG